MFIFFKKLTLSRPAWFLLMMSAAGLEATALYFQHGMGLQPCVMCIYERLALLVVLFAGMLGILAPKFAPLRWIALLMGLFGALKGLMLAIKRTDYQLHPAPWNTCLPFLDFPEALPLDQWFPAIFAAGGDCGKISWEFLGLVMPQWLIVIFAVYLALFILLILSQFKRLPTRDLFY